MMNFFRKHMRVIFFVVIIAFIGGIAFSVGGSSFVENYALKVNNETISLKTFNSVYSNAIESIRQTSDNMPSDEELNQLKSSILQSLLQEEVLYQQAKEYGVVVSDEELSADIQNTPEFQNNGYFDHRIYYSLLQAINMTPKEFEASRRKQIAGTKLRLLLLTSVKLFDTEYGAALMQDKKVTKSALAGAKANKILNEWYASVVSGYKIKSNDRIIFGNY